MVKLRPWSASERLFQHLEAFQSLGMALDIHKVRVTSASWPQKSLPESHWAARGTSLGHFFEACGRHFLEQTATKIHVYRFLMHFCCQRRFSQVLDQMFIVFCTKNDEENDVDFQSITIFFYLANL